MQLDNIVTDENLRKVIVISESTWHSNFVESSPLVRTIGNVQLLLSDSFFTENYSFIEGTAIYIDQSLAVITNTTFLNNYAQDGGVIVVAGNSFAQVVKSNMMGNFGVQNGVFVAKNGAVLQFVESILQGNRAINCKFFSFDPSRCTWDSIIFFSSV